MAVHSSKQGIQSPFLASIGIRLTHGAQAFMQRKENKTKTNQKPLIHKIKPRERGGDGALKEVAFSLHSSHLEPPTLPTGPGIRLPPDLPDGCVPAGAHTPLSRLRWLWPCPLGTVTEPGLQGPRAELAGGLLMPHSLQGICQKEKPLHEEIVEAGQGTRG